MAENNFKDTVKSLFSEMDGFLSAKTVVGEPVNVGDTIIVPLVDVSFGMGAGAWQRSRKDSSSGGMGGKMSPTAVLVIKDGMVRVVDIGSNDALTKIIDTAPDIINRFMGRSGFDPEVDEVINNMKEEAEDE